MKKYYPVFRVKTSGSNDYMASADFYIAAVSKAGALTIYNQPGYLRQIHGSALSVTQVKHVYSTKIGAVIV